MLFSSPLFLFLFLPFSLLLYYLTPKKFKNTFLLLASLFFYTWGERELVILILLSTFVDYSCGIIISNGKRKTGLFLSILFNTGILAYFKYSNFVLTNFIEFLSLFSVEVETATYFSNIVLPLGISFYTFQTMSYTIDVYLRKVKATRNFINFATYVTFFPQLIAGPIVRYKIIENQLVSRNTTTKQFSEGVERFIIGLSKKMIIANNCAFLADNIFSLHNSDLSAYLAWIGVIAYGFQIYFDFSGYSDMAIGLGKMFGFDFPENFNYPYISQSIREFWRRWHITLSNWFKDYVYISLGGNRKGVKITYINLLVVFFITGLWHGANWTFIAWGLFHGFFIIVERIGFDKILEKLPKVISHLYLLLVVSISWVFFRSENITDALNYIQSMFSFNLTTNLDFMKFLISKEIMFVLILATVFSTPVYKRFDSLMSFLNPKTFAGFKMFALMTLLVICFFYVATDAYNPFIYFRF
ncbi:MBOAT family O-acyltransferase [Geojedonia litorea]